MGEFDFDVVSDVSDAGRRRAAVLPRVAVPETVAGLSRSRDDNKSAGQSVVTPEGSGLCTIPRGDRLG